MGEQKTFFLRLIYITKWRKDAVILLEQYGSELLEGASPSEELMRCAIRNVACGIISRCFQRLDSLLHTVRILLATARNEDMLRCFLALKVLWLIDASAEESPVAEHFWSCECSHSCLHTAH